MKLRLGLWLLMLVVYSTRSECAPFWQRIFERNEEGEKKARRRPPRPSSTFFETDEVAAKKVRQKAQIVTASSITPSPGISDDKKVAKKTEVDYSSKERNLLIVVDVSGSMYFLLPEVKSAVSILTKDLKPDHAVGLVDFDGCEDSRIRYPVPLARGAGPRVREAVNQLHADGPTDLFGALQLVRRIQERSGECVKLALFTDNIDTCDRGTPQAALAGVDSDCLELSIVTTITEEENLYEYFKQITDLTQGHVITAQTKEEMLKALRKIAKRKQKSSSGAAFKAKKKEETDKKEDENRQKEEKKKEEKKKEEERRKPAEKKVGAASQSEDGLAEESK